MEGEILGVLWQLNERCFEFPDCYCIPHYWRCARIRPLQAYGIELAKPGNGIDPVYRWDGARTHRHTSVPPSSQADLQRPPRRNRHAKPTRYSAYDKENRMTEHIRGSVINTSVYDGTGHKGVEESGSARTTLIWDGDRYLGELA